MASSAPKLKFSPLPKEEESTYLARIGLSLMTLGTLGFFAVSNSLSSSPSLAPSQSTPQFTAPILYVTPQPQSLSETLGLEELASRLRATETKLYDLQIHGDETSASLEKLQTRWKSEVSDEAKTMQALAILACLSLWTVGLIILRTALNQVSQQWWLRTLSLGLMGANLGVSLAIWKSEVLTWDVLVLCGLAMMDTVMIFGVMLLRPISQYGFATDLAPQPEAGRRRHPRIVVALMTQNTAVAGAVWFVSTALGPVVGLTVCIVAGIAALTANYAIAGYLPNGLGLISRAEAPRSIRE